jgi:hypothetical protein
VSDGELMGRNEYARHQGVAPNAVTKAVRDGRIARAVVWEGGKIKAIRWRLADELWARNTDRAEALKSRRTEPPGAARSAAPPATADVWTDRALARAVALARVDALEECQSLGFLNAEPLTPSELLDLVDVLIGALAERLRAAIGAGPADAVHAQLLAGERDVCSLTLDQALELARGAAAKVPPR